MKSIECSECHESTERVYCGRCGCDHQVADGVPLSSGCMLVALCGPCVHKAHEAARDGQTRIERESARSRSADARVKVIRVDRNSLLAGEPALEVTHPDGTRQRHTMVRIDGPSTVMQDAGGAAWVETSAPIRTYNGALPKGRAIRRL